MNCSNCGKPLPPGVAFCPSCNAATPYNTTGQNPASGYDPTVAASSYGNPPSAPGPNQANPYGSSPNNYPPQNPYTAYGVPGNQQPSSPYGSNTSPYGQSAQQPYGSSPQNFYAPPPQSAQVPYGYGAPGTPGYAPGMQPGGFGTGTPPRRRSKVGLIVGISLLVLVLLCGGIIALFAYIGKNAASTVNSTATVTSASGVPTTNDIVPAASKIIFNPQTSSTIDSNYEPTKIATTFAPNKDMYLTFQEDSQGKDGYIQVKWYSNGTLDDARILKHSGQNDHGYFAHTFTDTGPVEAALYWCTQATCNDAQLAQVTTFTISNSAAVSSSNAVVATVIEGNRRSI